MPEGVGYGPQNTASIGKELNVIGEYAYAYSGEYSAKNSEETILEFTSGSYLFVGDIIMSGPMKTADIGVGNVAGYTLTLNGITAMLYKIETTQEDSPMTISVPLLIPPYTEVKLNVISDATATDQFITASIVGRAIK